MVPQMNVPLAPLSTLGVGGAAKWLTRAQQTRDVADAHAWCADRGVPMFVLGGGSNLVIADEGFGGLVLHIALRGTDLVVDGEEMLVTSRAGEPWDDVVAAVVARGFAGLECLSGIPGSVGGTPIQNVGAYGQEVAGSIERVTVFDRTGGATAMLAPRECGFSYRMSRFKADDTGRYVVCEVAFRVRRGSPTTTYPDVAAHLHRSGVSSPSVADVRDAVLAIRRQKGMVVDARDPDTRSVGSFFVNPIVTEDARETIASIAGEAAPEFSMGGGRVKIPAAWLIERSGFTKGYRAGAVGISTKHPLAIVTRAGATSRDVVRMAGRIKRAVADRFGVWLMPEPIFVGFGDEAEVDYVKQAGP